jgi:hypothetical protein
MLFVSSLVVLLLYASYILADALSLTKRVIGACCSKEAVKKLEQDGVPHASIPDWLGGGCAPVKTYDYINQLISSKRAHGS